MISIKKSLTYQNIKQILTLTDTCVPLSSVQAKLSCGFEKHLLNFG